MPWGSSIDLVVGSGLNEERIQVPNRIGLTFAEAQAILLENGILLGAVVPDPGITDTAAAFIWKQSPPRYNEEKEPVFIQSGQLLDLWISPEMKEPRDTLDRP